MKIFIPSYGRAGTICTHKLLDGLDWKVVVHDISEFVSYSKVIPEDRLLISSQELGIAKQRNWIIENLVFQDEWFCFMDDNIKEFWRVHPNFYNDDSIPTHLFNHAFWDKRYRHPCDPVALKTIFDETCAKADELGAKLAGFATTDNPFFRKMKWRKNGYVTTKTALVKKSKLRFDERFFAKDDMDFSAANLDAFDVVLVNNYVFPKANHYDPGGIGKREARILYKQKETQLLCEKWPHLCSPLKRRSATGDLPEEVSLKKRRNKNEANRTAGSVDREDAEVH